jgi:hypothetical protein
MNPELAISHYMLGKLTSKSIVGLANSWLENGIYTDSLNFILMETNPVMVDVGPLFESVIKELGLEVPTKVEAAKFVAKDTVQKMVSGEIDLMEGANFLYWEIHHEVIDELPDGKYLGSNLGLEHIFCWLREIWDCRDGSMILYHTDMPRKKAEVKFMEHLKEEAVKWLASKA